jgi:hypothetical protein
VVSRKGRQGKLFWGGGRLFEWEQPKIWKMGAGQRRRNAVLSIQSKKQLKASFSWFLPDVLNGWPILPKSFFINQ